MTNDFSTNLIEWFSLSKRDFPWRENRSPYSVLISEIMLQQTRASVVVSYYNSWLKKFPDFNSLAKATEEEVIKAWEGLGYYSRARNLKLLAERVMQEFNGSFPKEIETILSFKGIGPYTAAAIVHFAFKKKALGADANIKKVLARFYGHSEILSNDKPILKLLDEFLPSKGSSECFEGLIELGATLCRKKPVCSMCPLSDGCIAYNENMTAILPVVKKRVKTKTIYRATFIIELENSVLIQKEEGNLMKGLYALPYININENYDLIMIKKVMKEKFLCSFSQVEVLDKVVHSFTRYKVVLTPIKCKMLKAIPLKEKYYFVSKCALNKYPFSSGYRKILRKLLYI